MSTAKTPRLELTREQAERLVRNYVAWGSGPGEEELRTRVIDRMVARGECVWHALARMNEKRCHCALCYRARKAALDIEASLHRVVREARGGQWVAVSLPRAARRLRLVRAVLGIPVDSWLRNLGKENERMRGCRG